MRIRRDRPRLPDRVSDPLLQALDAAFSAAAGTVREWTCLSQVAVLGVVDTSVTQTPVTARDMAQ